MTDPEKNRRDDSPETAVEKVVREIEDTANRTRDSAEQRLHRGEAGEAITPNARAQEESEGD
ncbi:hypothetical protein SLINC_7732 [Streptomyces lincolnensis]|uniref:Uncharacterized protein n=1 Tax=Streptomyces lincolnensis TaxID=1915 RepID=A0A1B1MMX8_STRLN|nr:hypothetical protein [Streptomyces lincolnensis]ANS69956.1 hypothetical protein SLINC_7732 [Streptomyces lincolnensis]